MRGWPRGHATRGMQQKIQKLRRTNWPRRSASDSGRSVLSQSRLGGLEPERGDGWSQSKSSSGVLTFRSTVGGQKPPAGSAPLLRT
jgi:hypothetical protein